MNDTFSGSGPVRPVERIHTLDVIRGFALSGILLANINASLPAPLNGMRAAFSDEPPLIEAAFGWFTWIFIDGNFYRMFSLLFGAGFMIFIDRARARGARAETLLLRRLAALLLIGLAHSVLVWWGDILTLYACLGILLLAFADIPAARLWKWGIAFSLMPLGWAWLQFFLTIDTSPSDPAVIATAQEARRVAEEAAMAVYTTGSWWEVAEQRLANVLSIWQYAIPVVYGLSAFGMFLIGAAVVRSGLLASLNRHAPALRRMAWIGFAAGIPIGMYSRLASINGWTGVGTADAISSVLLCLAYVATLTLLLQKERIARLLRPLAVAGRMALTNYLTQSLVFTWIFCGYGLGIGDTYGRVATNLMALCFFGIQICISHWWLARYRFGPAEWLWRTMTYGEIQPLRAVPNPA